MAILLEVENLFRYDIDSSTGKLTVYYYDSGSATWKTLYKYDLPNLAYDTDVYIRKSIPALRLKDTQTGGKDWVIRNNVGYLELYDEDIDSLATEWAFKQNFKIEKSTPLIRLKGTETGAKTFELKEDAGTCKLTNVSDAVDEFIVDVTNNRVDWNRDLRHVGTGSSLLTHASRHDRGGADALNWTAISNLADSGDVSCTVGTGGTATRTTVYTPPTNWTNVLPLSVYMAVGGTVATGETVSISVKMILDDASEYEIGSYSVTGATGTSTTSVDFATLLDAIRAAAANVDGKRVTNVAADVSSSAASTAATATARVLGLRT